MINIRINYLVIVIVSIISVGVITLNIEWPNQQQDQVKRIISRGELRVSTINSPLMSFNDKQEASGFDYELTKRFADYLGVKLRINVRQISINFLMTLKTVIVTLLLQDFFIMRSASIKHSLALPTIPFPSS